MMICSPPFVFFVAEFPAQTGNEIETEFRKSRAAVIASEPIPENLEIKGARVKKTVRSVSGPPHSLHTALESPLHDSLTFYLQ